MTFSSIRRLLSSQLALFLLVGGLAAAVQWASRFGFSLFAPYPAAIVLAYVIGMLIAFELNRRFVFPVEGDERKKQFARFALVNVLSFATVWTVSYVLGAVLLPRVMPIDWAEALGHGAGVLSPALASYFLHKHITFRTPTAAAVNKSDRP